MAIRIPTDTDIGIINAFKDAELEISQLRGDMRRVERSSDSAETTRAIEELRADKERETAIHRSAQFDGDIKVAGRAFFQEYPEVVRVSDDFIHTSDETGEYGTLNWNLSGDTGYAGGFSVGADDHPGNLLLKPDNDTGDAAYYFANTSVYPMLKNITEYWQTWILRTPSVNIGYQNAIIGINSTIDYAGGTDGIYFYLDYGVNTNWYARTNASSSTTDTDTGVAGAANTWYRLDIHYGPNDVQFFVDKVLKASHTANIPANAMQPVFAVECDATGNTQTLNSWLWDYYALTYTVDR